MSGTPSSRPIPYVKIIHQPSSVYRMRYKAEKRTALLFSENASLANQNDANNASSSSNKKPAIQRKKNGLPNEIPDGTFPKIEIVDGCGPATLVVSCVNKSEPYHVHPHRLTGDSCKSGVAVINIPKGEKYFELSGVSIEFTKKSDIDESIKELKNKNVDPFNVGFGFDKNGVDLTQIRLCFQVYLRDSLESNEIIRDGYHILKPVVSHIICNSSRKSSLSITRSFNLDSYTVGGSSVVLFLKKLEKDQKSLHAKFYDDSGWSTVVKINENQIHYQSSLWFDAPPYKALDIQRDVTVSLKLFVPFTNENEKIEYLKQLNLEERDDEDSMDSSNSSSNDFYKGEAPEGKYESKVFEFVYKPQIIQKKRNLDTAGFYELINQSDRDAIDEISPASKKKLFNRQLAISLGSSNGMQQIPNLQDENNPSIDPAMLNHLIVNSDTIRSITSPMHTEPDTQSYFSSNEIQHIVNNVSDENRYNPNNTNENFTDNHEQIDTNSSNDSSLNFFNDMLARSEENIDLDDFLNFPFP